MRLLFLLLLFCQSSFAAYTTMTLEGVKEANGVWSAAGVVDNMGFVRTTGAVTVAGVTASTAVALPVEKVAATTLLRTAGRLAGPASLALAAYDVYQWMTTDPNVSLQNSNGNWFTVNDRLGYCYLPAPIYVNANNYALSNCVAAAEAKAQASDKPVVVCPDANNTWYLKPKSCGPGSAFGYFSPQSTISSPSTEADFNRLMAPTWAVIANGFNNLPSLLGKIPVTSISFPPFSSWLGDPYYKDGNWYRDRADITPAPAPSQPTRVRVDIGPVKITGATDPNVKPDSGPATGTAPKEQDNDFCKKNPMSIACIELGDLKPEPFDPIEKPFRITPQSPWGADNSQCPAPKVMTLATGGTYTMSYQPTCDFFSGIRPAVIALAFLVALYIALGIPTGKGD